MQRYRARRRKGRGWGAGPHRPHRRRRRVGLQLPRRRLRCRGLLRGYRGGGAARGGGGGGGVGGGAEQRERAMVLHLAAVIARGEDGDEVAPRAEGPVHACLHLLVRAHDEAEVLLSQEAARHARAEEEPDRAHVVGARALVLHGVVPQHLCPRKAGGGGVCMGVGGWVGGWREGGASRCGGTTVCDGVGGKGVGRGSGVGAAQRDMRRSKWEGGGQGCVRLRLSGWWVGLQAPR